MRQERIRYTAEGRLSPFFATPEITSAKGSWGGFSFEEATSPGDPLPSHAWAKTTLLYVTAGSASLRWKHRGVWTEDKLGRGTVSIIRRDAEIESAIPNGSIPMMVLQLDVTQLTSQAPEDVSSIERSLTSANVVNDDRLASILSVMSGEVRDGCPSGRIFAESISISLLAYLAARYSSDHVRPAAGCLSPSDMKLVTNYVRGHVSSAISIEELARLIAVSPSRFARAFKATSGMTPYQFVMRERILLATSLMKNPKISFARIAAEVGFANQSHFAKVFSQFIGVTPKRYRSRA